MKYIEEPTGTASTAGSARQSCRNGTKKDEQFAKEFNKMLTHCLSFAETMCGLGKYDKTSQAAIDPENTE